MVAQPILSDFTLQTFARLRVCMPKVPGILACDKKGAPRNRETPHYVVFKFPYTAIFLARDDECPPC